MLDQISNKWKKLAQDYKSKLAKKNQTKIDIAKSKANRNSNSTSSTSSTTSNNSQSSSLSTLQAQSLSWSNPTESIDLIQLDQLPPMRLKRVKILQRSLTIDEKDMQSKHSEEMKSLASAQDSNALLPPLQDPLDIAHLIEHHAHNLPDVDYGFTIRTIKVNLQRNPELRYLVRQGFIEPRKIVQMDPSEMATSELKEARRKAQEFYREAARSDWLRQKTINENSADSELECFKCHSKKVLYREMQTRSADEPMTVFALCLSCGKRWKQ